MSTTRPAQSELITLPAACRVLGISPSKAVKAAEAGEFPRIIKLGSARYVGRRVFEQWLDERCGPRSAA